MCRVAPVCVVVMFSPERFGPQRTSFGVSEAPTGRNFIGLKTAFRSKDSRTPLQKAAHFRFSEPATPSVQSGRGWRPSDLSDPYKRQFLTELTGRIFHLAASGVGLPPSKPRPHLSSLTLTFTTTLCYRVLCTCCWREGGVRQVCNGVVLVLLTLSVAVVS